MAEPQAGPALAPPWRSHVGLLLVGRAVFNLVEGVVDHQVLGIHNVRDDLGGPLSWDIGFLVFGALLTVTGFAMIRSGANVVDTRCRSPRPSQEKARLR